MQAERFVAADYRGCVSINTMIEVADDASPAHGVAAELKRALTDYLDGLLANALRAKRLAEALLGHRRAGGLDP